MAEKKIIPGYHLVTQDDIKKFLTNFLNQTIFATPSKDDKDKNRRDNRTRLFFNNLNLVEQALTSSTVNAEKNYENFEQIGDVAIANFLVTYFYEKFPQLYCTEGVKVVARLRINYGSRVVLAGIAANLGFWDVIQATHELREEKKLELLEDTFEAVIGALATIVDTDTIRRTSSEEKMVGVGYSFVYRILESIYNTMPISLRYEDLYDAKTRLKELGDIFSKELGLFEYECFKDQITKINTCQIFHGGQHPLLPNGMPNMKHVIYPKGGKILIGTGIAQLKDAAEQQAATNAIKKLAPKYVKVPPIIYAKFAGDYVEKPTNPEKEVLNICQNKENINDLFSTKGKSKYQTSYVSTPLAQFCRLRKLDCVKVALMWGADPNKRDYFGMTPLDILLVGDVAPEIVAPIFEQLLGKNNILELHQNIYDLYYRKFYIPVGKKYDIFISATKNLKMIE